MNYPNKFINKSTSTTNAPAIDLIFIFSNICGFPNDNLIPDGNLLKRIQYRHEEMNSDLKKKKNSDLKTNNKMNNLLLSKEDIPAAWHAYIDESDE